MSAQAEDVKSQSSLLPIRTDPKETDTADLTEYEIKKETHLLKISIESILRNHLELQYAMPMMFSMRSE